MADDAKTLSVSKGHKKDGARAVVELARREAYAELTVIREVLLNKRSNKDSKKK
jgi:hypothetical protein